MPPRNPPRSLAGEDQLAARIAHERERRGWSYEQLAKRMTEVGCPMNQSAINKIEKGQPRRRITVDELLGFAKVFNMNISALVLDPSAIAGDMAERLFSLWVEAERKVQEARAQADQVAEEYQKRTGLDPHTVQRLTQAAADRPVAERG